MASYTTSFSLNITVWNTLLGLEPSPLTMILSLVGGILVLVLSVHCSVLIERGPQNRTQWILIRTLLAILASILFIDLLFAPYGQKNRYFRTSGVTNGIYGLLKTWEICFSSLIDGVPLPSWVRLSHPASNGAHPKSGKEEETRETLHSIDTRGWWYSFDVISTLRGVSWLPDRRFDIATPSLVQKIASRTTRGRFVLDRILWLLTSLFVMDIIDTVSKEWSYMDGQGLGRIAQSYSSTKITTLYPAYAHQATSKPFYGQLALVACTALSTQFSVEIFYTAFGLLCVGVFNVSPSAFPHFFNNPFYIHNYTSVRHFWGYQWHHIFRQVMTRVTDPFLHVFRIPKRSALGTIMRVVIAFTLSGLIHCVIQARAQALYLAPNVELVVLDPDTLRFFMSQPLAIAFEHLCMFPLVRFLPPLVKRTLMVVWTLGWLTWSARWWVDVWIKMGMYQPEERVVLFSVIRGLWRGEWYIAGLPAPS
ncbi:hypothetical protein PIIN_10229 [Serendipita indica DSM 11827]|uniref:Wax synthase domain-containing protein n=1 Tax=Serendipita indica (strain DSM 11827) TaxID=1109443 RepID=G4TY44_SERID|nr:hypothetical protein PIIN_10229 [Serendipita indica DSM 11827]